MRLEKWRRGRVWVIAVSVCGVIGLAPSGATAQVPDAFTNLKVLPPDIAKTDLVDTMKAFAMSLGVRCGYCHVGEGDDLSTYDFASDEKSHKVIAREMLRMVMTINKEYIDKLPAAEGHSRNQVRCVTCHRGKAEPEIEAP